MNPTDRQLIWFLSIILMGFLNNDSSASLGVIPKQHARAIISFGVLKSYFEYALLDINVGNQNL